MTASIRSPSCAPTRSTRPRTGSRAVRGWAGGRMGRLVGARRSRLSRQRQPQPPRRRAAEQHLRRPADPGRAGVARIGGHQLIAAVEHQEEDFRARDTAFFGGTDQDRRAASPPLSANGAPNGREAIVTDLAVRHDSFSAFDDATTFRASLLVRPAAALDAARRLWRRHRPADLLRSVTASSRAPSSAIRPCGPSTRAAGRRGCAGSDDALRLSASPASRRRLEDEIVDVFDPATFLSSTANADRQEPPRRHRARRWAGAMPTGSNLDVNYTWLDADEQRVAGAALVREVRRPAAQRQSGRATARRAGSAGARASPMSASDATPISTCSRRRR